MNHDPGTVSVAPPRVRPTWDVVEKLVAELSAARTSFTGLNGRTYRLERYDHGWRVMVFADKGSSRWVELEDIRACWSTFERLGRIEGEDVLEPGRCSSLMMAIFMQVPGIEQAAAESAALSFA